MDMELFRPNRTLLAKTFLGDPQAVHCDEDIYDASGSKVIEQVSWQYIQDIPPGVIDRVVFHPGSPQEDTWFVNRDGVVYGHK